MLFDSFHLSPVAARAGLGALALVACSSQAATSYPGTALATLSGTVQTASTPTPTGAVDAALVWAKLAFSPDEQLIQSVTWVGESAPVSGQFPASFTLNVYAPPPDSVLFACPSSTAHMAVAQIVAVPGGTDINNGNIAKSIVGAADVALLLYLDTDEPAGWSCLANMGFTFAPTKGFHLLEQVADSLQPRAEGACYPAYTEASDGLRAPITMQLWGGAYPLSGGPFECAWYQCITTCETKAQSCNAMEPPGKAMSSAEIIAECNKVCQSSPTPPTASQLSCIESTSCRTLGDTFKATGTVCGIGDQPFPDGGALGGSASP